MKGAEPSLENLMEQPDEGFERQEATDITDVVQDDSVEDVKPEQLEIEELQQKMAELQQRMRRLAIHDDASGRSTDGSRIHFDVTDGEIDADDSKESTSLYGRNTIAGLEFMARARFAMGQRQQARQAALASTKVQTFSAVQPARLQYFLESVVEEINQHQVDPDDWTLPIC